MPRARIKGGERNENSGKRWTKEELNLVLKLFFEDPNLKIHESNPELFSFAQKLNRTIRSVEAQLLMFRNLSKHGDYGYGNMSNTCKIVWKEYLEKIKNK